MQNREEAAARWQAEHPGEDLPPRLKDAALYQATKRTSKRLTITAAALLRYILDSTVGDKSLTLQAIQTHCPRGMRTPFNGRNASPRTAK